MAKGHRHTEEGAQGNKVSNGIWVASNQVQGRLGDVGGEQFPVSADAVTVVTVGAHRKWKSIRYRTTIYANQHQHESPIFRFGLIQEAETFRCGGQTKRGGVERDRARRS